MRKANRIGAKNVVVLGEDELKNREIEIKNMDGGEDIKTLLQGNEILKSLLPKIRK